MQPATHPTRPPTHHLTTHPPACRRIEDEARKDEVVLPPDFENLDPRQYNAEMQRYIEYRRKARAEKENQANDLEISGLAWVYVGIMVLVLVGSATLPTSW